MAPGLYPPAPPYVAASTRTGLEISSLWYSVFVDFFSTNAGESLIEFGPAVLNHFSTPASAWFWVLLLFACCLLPYLVFQAHCLPHCIGKWVGRGALPKIERGT